MAFFKKKDLPDLPSPPDKFSDSSEYSDDDFPRYTPAMNFDADKIGMKSKMPMPIPEFPKEEHSEMGGHDRRPLFIKIDKYEDAIATLNSIRDKLEEASNIISELRQIRRDEDTQLDEWSEHIRSVKEKLMNVDGMLFE